MIFKGINGQNVEFRLISFDPKEFELMTGIKLEDDYEPYDVGFNLIIGNRDMLASILISDVVKIVDWFEDLLNNKDVDLKLSVYHGQLSFDLLKNDFAKKIIRITNDGSVPIPGVGGYSGNLNEILKAYFVECEMDGKELETIIMDLKKELYHSLNRN
ncbi:WapI family immunity protein [Chryseobacterium mucoviscidosis]|uniref:WapI family immunity protein n=1 Tax=Chryseobacterium mucoviscidosis TaxID=1945581 RepID=UPI0031D0D280